MTPTVARTALLLLLGPILGGMLIGWAIRPGTGTRRTGVGWALGLVLLPAASVVALLIFFPIVGCWDAALEGVLLGIGVLLGAHRVGAAPLDIALGTLSATAALCLLELAVRALLPPPPAFPSGAGVHLLLTDAIHSASATLGWDLRSREIACSLIYPDQFVGLLDLGGERDIQRPSTYRPRDDARSRVLHIGDSMAYGFGVERQDSFTSELARLEPGVEHVNAAIPGIAPDAYLALLEAWTDHQRFDEVVFYVFVDNDLRDLDGPYPCCGFEPLLAYDERGATLRCKTATPVHLDRAGFEWLRYNSPPPYLLRAIIDQSSAAAYLSAALAEPGQRYSLSTRSSPQQQLQHLATILRSARQRLEASHTRFEIVILPGRGSIEATQPDWVEAEQIAAIARDAGIRTLDAGPPLRAAAQRGDDLFIGPPQRNDPHFNPAGHRLVAEWLRRERLAGP